MTKNTDDKLLWHELLDSWRIDFSKITHPHMHIPIIGRNRNEKAALEYKEKQEEKFQNEMTLKLIDWQINHQCSVTAVLRTINTTTQAGHSSMIVFFKLQDKEIKALEDIKEKFIKELEADGKPKN